MPTFPLPLPLINGHYYSHASIEVRMGPVVITEFTAIDYEPSLEVGDVYGSRTQKFGSTRGQENGSCTMRLLYPAWEVLRRALGNIGYGERYFPTIVSRAEVGMPVITDLIVGRITNAARSDAVGTDASQVALTLNVLRIVEGWDGAGGGMIASPIGAFGF